VLLVRRKRHKDVPPADGKANEQLWKHLRNEIIEDRELLEGASADPAKILELAQDWVHYDRKAQTRDSPRYRFCLVIDDEVIDHLLQLPMPPSKEMDIPGIYSVKAFQASKISSRAISGLLCITCRSSGSAIIRRTSFTPITRGMGSCGSYPGWLRYSMVCRASD
jgi:hypothetical protein